MSVIQQYYIITTYNIIANISNYELLTMWRCTSKTSKTKGD